MYKWHNTFKNRYVRKRSNQEEKEIDNPLCCCGDKNVRHNETGKI